MKFRGVDVVKDELIIKFKKHTGLTAQPDGKNSRSEILKNKKASVQKVWSTGAEHWKVSTGNLDSLIQELNSNPEVEYAEPNYIVRQSFVPNDPDFKNSWALNATSVDIGALDAWDITHGDTAIVAGVLDSGIDYLHEDLKANIWINRDEIPSNGIDDDNNGYIDDIRGWDFVNNDNDPMDDNGHGTHVAGIIGAKGHNNQGTAGVAWDVKLAALKFMDSNGEGKTNNAIQAIEYCINNGIKITNNSWGGPTASQALYDEISRANESGIVFAAAAGNNGTDNDLIPQYPASFNLPNIISVAATDKNDMLASFSNYGKTSVDVAAPGVDIYSCAPNNGYVTMSGTSMATPFVTGAVVLIKSIFPEKSNLEIISRLLSSADPNSSMYGKCTTGGRLNLFKPLMTSSIAQVKLSAEEFNLGGAVINSSNMPQKKLSIINNSSESVTIDTVRSESGFLISFNSGSFSDVLFNVPLGARQTVEITIKADPKEAILYEGLIAVRFSRGSVSWNKEARCRLKAFPAGTCVSGGEVSGTWSKSMSPIIINSPVKVAAGKNLEIGSGVEVLFFNNAGISSTSDVLAGAYNIRAAGTKQDSIYFKPADSGATWSGFSMSGRGRYIFEYCNFLNASKNISGGAEGRGGAIQCNGPDLRIVNSRFIGNRAADEGGAVQYLGTEGLVYIDSSGFEGNEAGLGGALALRGKENWILNSIFKNNKCSQGIVRIQGTSTETYSAEKAFVYNCSFRNNLSSYGGNMIDASSLNKIFIKNCLAVKNYISINKAVINLTSISAAVLSNCTLYQNSTGQDGAALGVSKVTECVLENSILWNDFGSEIRTFQESYQKFKPSFNSIKNYSADNVNINSAPDFTDTLSFHLTPNSVLRDKGNLLSVYNDLDGTRNDLGIEGGNQLAFYPVNIDFGKNGLVNSTMKTIPVECVSFYKDALPVKSWSISSDAFTITAMPGQILPLKTNTISINFIPKQVKSYSDTLYVNTEFVPVNKIKISLQGICQEINSIGGAISGELKNTGGGIYHVVNDLWVSKGSALTIDPGVTLLFQPNTKLTVEGDLQVKGTAEQKVVFTSESDTSYSGIITVRGYNTKNILLENLIMKKMLGFNIQSITRRIVFNSCEFTGNKNLNEVNSPFFNISGSAAEFNNSIFAGNNTEGPLVYIASGKLSVNNCLITRNTSAGGYILSDNSIVNIYNSSIFKNRSYSGILLRTDPLLGAFRDSCRIVNTILADNINADAKYPYEISLMQLKMTAPAENPEVKIYLELANSCIKGGRAKIFSPANSKVYLILSQELDPAFADTDGRLGGSSTCIDAGTNSYKSLNFSSADLAGNYRIWNKRIDIGAYEYGSRKYYPVPEKSVLDYPKDQSTVAKEVTLKWKTTPGALSYKIQVSGTNTFESSISDSTFADTSKAISLNPGSKYFWRVMARNSTALGPWSEVWSFSTFIAAPLSPMLNKPGNSAVKQPLALTLYWRKLKASEKYHLQVSTKLDFSSILVNDTTLADTLKQIPGLSTNTVYYWRVRGKNQGGFSPWSEEWNFTTVPPLPKAPVLAQPSNDTKDQGVIMRLAWRANQLTDKYRLMVSEDDKFSKIKIADSAVTDTVKEVKELKEGMKYFWKVSSINSGGESPSSEVWNFTTLLNAPDSLKAEVLGRNQLKLSWKDKSNGEAGFIIERKDAADFIALDTADAGIEAYTDSTVRNLSTYEYRVRSYTAFVLSAYSSPVSIIITGVDEYSLVPKDYTLLQNYPNPFNPATVIKYGLPTESRVRLIIYNSLGETVGEYVNEVQRAGYHQINFNAGGISSGVYYYLIEARASDGSRDYRKVKKLMVIK